MVIGAEPLCDLPRIVQLVCGQVLGEPDGERLDRRAGLLGHQCGDQARVEPSAEHDAEGDVADHALPDGAPQQLQKLRLIPLPVLTDVRGRTLPRRPVRALLEPAVRCPDQGAAGVQLGDAVEERSGTGHVPVCEEQLGRERVQRGIDQASGDQALHLRGEGEAVRETCEVQGLDAHAVAGQHEAALARVPYRDREHPSESLGKVRSEFLVQVNDDLRVALRGEAVASRGQLGPQLGEVEDLAVEDGPDRLVLVGQRLVAPLQVDDAEAAHPDRRAAAEVEAAVVGAAVANDLDHAPQRVFGDRRRLGEGIDDAADSTHRYATAIGCVGTSAGSM